MFNVWFLALSYLIFSWPFNGMWGTGGNSNELSCDSLIPYRHVLQGGTVDRLIRARNVFVWRYLCQLHDPSIDVYEDVSNIHLHYMKYICNWIFISKHTFTFDGIIHRDLTKSEGKRGGGGGYIRDFTESERNKDGV